jgi:hypothetical protein
MASTRPRHLRTRPWLEVLEDRTLLAQVFTVSLPGDPVNPDGTPVGFGLQGSLRFCVQQADLPANAGSTIQFGGAVGSVITLTHGELAISEDMTIQGPGVNLSISGGFSPANPPTQPFAIPGSRVFDITSNTAHVSISNLTITKGNAQPFVSSIPGNQGGNIFNGGFLSLTNCVVSNGFSLGTIGGPPGRGGGIFNAEGTNGPGSGAHLTLDNTIVTTNTAQGNPGVTSGSLPGIAGGLGAGGGIYNDVNAVLTLTGGSQINNNTAIGGFGGRRCRRYWP